MVSMETSGISLDTSEGVRDYGRALSVLDTDPAETRSLWNKVMSGKSIANEQKVLQPNDVSEPQEGSTSNVPAPLELPVSPQDLSICPLKKLRHLHERCPLFGRSRRLPTDSILESIV